MATVDVGVVVLAAELVSYVAIKCKVQIDDSVVVVLSFCYRAINKLGVVLQIFSMIGLLLRPLNHWSKNIVA